MKTTLQAAYFKNQFNQISNCAITQDICSRLLGLLHAFVYQLYNKDCYFAAFVISTHQCNSVKKIQASGLITFWNIWAKKLCWISWRPFWS